MQSHWELGRQHTQGRAGNTIQFIVILKEIQKHTELPSVPPLGTPACRSGISPSPQTLSSCSLDNRLSFWSCVNIYSFYNSRLLLGLLFWAWVLVSTLGLCGSWSHLSRLWSKKEIWCFDANLSQGYTRSGPGKMTEFLPPFRGAWKRGCLCLTIVYLGK